MLSSGGIYATDFGGTGVEPRAGDRYLFEQWVYDVAGTKFRRTTQVHKSNGAIRQRTWETWSGVWNVVYNYQLDSGGTESETGSVPDISQPWDDIATAHGGYSSTARSASVADATASATVNYTCVDTYSFAFTVTQALYNDPLDPWTVPKAIEQCLTMIDWVNIFTLVPGYTAAASVSYVGPAAGVPLRASVEFSTSLGVTGVCAQLNDSTQQSTGVITSYGFAFAFKSLVKFTGGTYTNRETQQNQATPSTATFGGADNGAFESMGAPSDLPIGYSADQIVLFEPGTYMQREIL